jgi:hypothetical protein
VIVNYLREYQLSLGVAHAQVYIITMYILVGLLVLGLICNSLVRPVDEKHFMTAAEEAALDARDAQARAAAARAGALAAQADPPTPTWKVTAARLAVGIPIAGGVWVTRSRRPSSLEEAEYLAGPADAAARSRALGRLTQQN